jgi:hypothetical protein
MIKGVLPKIVLIIIRIIMTIIIDFFSHDSFKHGVLVNNGLYELKHTPLWTA